jgi:cell division septation protein DedD
MSSDGFFNFNRPRRQNEPNTPDERGQDSGANEPHTPRQGAPDRRDPGADALLELARLIGQTDPFSPASGRADDVHGPDGRPESGGRLANVSANVSRGGSSPTAAARDTFGRSPAQLDRPHDDRSYQDPSYRDQSYDDRLTEDRFHQHQPFEGRSFEAHSSLDRGTSFRREPDFGQSRAPMQPTHPDADSSATPHADSFDFLQLPGRGEYSVAPRHESAHEEGYGNGDHHEDPMTGRRYPAFGQRHEDYADEYHEDEYGHDRDHEYDTEHQEPDGEESGVKRRSSTKVVVAVLGLAVFGSAAAFGYRTVFKATPSGPTPIIRADNSPTKITPAGTDTSVKPANGRFGGSGEQLVRRDEEPVDVGSTFRSGVADAAGRLPDTAPPAEIVPVTAGPAPAGDTRRVRTVTIRADQGSASPDRTASRASPPPQSQPAQPLPTPQRQAAVAPAPAASPTPAAIAPDSVPAGGFVVQLSAQRSEAEAQASFRSLQSKYGVLNGREPLIRRKDQGDRGIFYAAQVGPFGVKSDADQLCEAVKSAGGACFVQRN